MYSYRYTIQHTLSCSSHLFILSVFDFRKVWIKYSSYLQLSSLSFLVNGENQPSIIDHPMKSSMKHKRFVFIVNVDYLIVWIMGPKKPYYVYYVCLKTVYSHQIIRWSESSVSWYSLRRFIYLFYSIHNHAISLIPAYSLPVI